MRRRRRRPVRAQRLADVGFPKERVELGGRVDEMLGDPFGSTRQVGESATGAVDPVDRGELCSESARTIATGSSAATWGAAST